MNKPFRSDKPRDNLNRPRRELQRHSAFNRRLTLESLEGRLALAADFGDAPAPYSVALAGDGARHEAIGPILGALRDSEDDGMRSTNAESDGADDDGVTFGTMRVGQLAATASIAISNAPDGARLDAWIDFNADGTWGGPGEQIANSVGMVNGNNTIRFDVPSWAADGQTFARFRLSTMGQLGVDGPAVDGEVEDYSVQLQSPVAATGNLSRLWTVGAAGTGVSSIFAADVDSDGDLDVLTTAQIDNEVAWYENDGNQIFERHTITTSARFAESVFAEDVDGDGDLDVLSASSQDSKIAWYENDGNQAFTAHTITRGANGARSVFAADVDQDGDIDVLSASSHDNEIAWYENDGGQTFTPHLVGIALYATSVSAADIDMDGDMDVLSTSLGDPNVKVAWYENDGQQRFTSRAIRQTRDSIFVALASDIDDDGDIDVLSASRDDGIALSLNDGQGTFAMHLVGSSGRETADVRLADLDGDGDLDIFAALGYSDELWWFENEGNGAFARHSFQSQLFGSSGVEAGDVDDDGDLDVLSIADSDGIIVWYENANLPCDSCDDYYSVNEDSLLIVDAMAGVLTNDGVQASEIVTPRLATPPTHGQVTLAADGSFTYEPDDNYFGVDSFSYSVTSSFDQPYDATVYLTVESVNDLPTARDDSFVADGGIFTSAVPGILANDSDADGVELIARLESPVAHGSLTLGVGGDFRYTAHIGYSGIDSFTYRVFDGAVESNLATVTIHVIASTADFGDAPAPYSVALVDNGARHEAIGPTLGLERDADPGTHSNNADGDAGDDGVTFATIRAGQLGATATVVVSNAPDGARLDAWIDFNADGTWGGPGEQIADSIGIVNGNNTIRFDVPSWAADGQTFARFRLSSTGQLGVHGASIDGEVEDYSVTIASPIASEGVFGNARLVGTTGGVSSSVEAADIDNDGDMDLLAASPGFGGIVWHENDGSQAFTRRTIATGVVGPGSATAVDIDGDGDLDILSANNGDSRIAWYENRGGGVFSPRTVSTAAGQPTAVFPADMDGDGDIDVLAASVNGNRIAWLENNGNQSFALRTITTAPVQPTSVSAADVDGDGDMDVLASSFEDDLIVWYENNGSQQLTAHTITTSADGATSVVTADVDADGDLDVLAASSVGATIAWYENGANHAFTTHVIDTAANGARRVIVADINGDGHVDVLSASLSSSELAWYENDGNQSFIPSQIGTPAFGSTWVSVADIDGDGDLDVLSAPNDLADVAWYENTSPCSSCADIYAVDEDGMLTVDAAASVLLNDGPIVGDVLSAQLTSAPAFGLLTFASDGTFAYVPRRDFSGTDSFTYRTSSDRRGSFDTIVTILVRAIPDSPIASNDVYRANVNGSLVTGTQASINAVYVARNSEWRYLDDGSNQETAWRERSFDDSSWRSGPAELGYGDGGESTVVDCGPAAGNECMVGNNPSNKYITTYFRRTFDVDDPGQVAELTVNIRRDDGAVVYVNGVELFRANMPQGDIAFNTTASRFTSDDGNTFFQFAGLNRTPLVAGVNVVAVEIHQESQVSSDISFDLELLATIQNAPGVLANDTDVDGELLSAVLHTGPYHGTLDLDAAGHIVYVPEPDFEGVDHFTYRSTDGALSSGTALVTINVGNANQAPLAADDRFVARSGTVLEIPVGSGLLKNDFDLNGDALTTTIITQPTRGSLSLASDGGFVYTPQNGFTGIDAFTYLVTDSAGLIGYATAKIHVVTARDPINGIPLASDDAFETISGSVSISAPGVLDNDHDPELRPLLAVVDRTPWLGSLSFAADGSLTYIPLPGFTGQDSFTYRATDGNTFSAPATVTINVGAAVPVGGVVMPVPPGSTLPDSTLPGSVQTPGTQGTTTSPGTLLTSGELNGDGRVDRADLAVVIAAYGTATGSLTYDAVADLNGDGRVSLEDVIVLRNGLIGFLQPSSSNALLRRASDRVSDERHEIENLTATAARQFKATVGEVHSPHEASLRAVRRTQAQHPEIRTLGSISPATVDCAFAEPLTSITALRKRSIGRLRS